MSVPGNALIGPAKRKLKLIGIRPAIHIENLLDTITKDGKAYKYFALDICKTSLTDVAHRLASKYDTGQVRVVALFGSFQDGLCYYGKISGPRVFCFFGSTITNDEYDDAVEGLRRMRR